jgi:molybdate transport system substrate-binding protein
VARRRAEHPGLRWLFVVVALGTAGAAAGLADAAEVRVLSAGAMRTIVTDLAEAFRHETGHTVRIESGTAGQLRDTALAGEIADVVIPTDTVLDQLAAKGGIIVADTRVDLARTGVGVAVREGAAHPDVSTPEAFKRAVLAATSIVYTDPARGGTSGIHVAGLLQQLGIADAVKGKTVLWPGGAAAEALVAGKAELCVTQISEIMPVKGVTLVGPLPRDIQKVTTYSAAVLTRAPHPEVAKALIAFLARPAWKPKLAAAGLDYRE